MKIHVWNHWSLVFSIDSSLVALLQQPCRMKKMESFRKVEILIDSEKGYKGYNMTCFLFWTDECVRNQWLDIFPHMPFNYKPI